MHEPEIVRKQEVFPYATWDTTSGGHGRWQCRKDFHIRKSFPENKINCAPLMCHT